MPSLVVNATTDYIKRTANIPLFSAVTMCGWVKLGTSTAGTARNIVSLRNGSTSGAGCTRWTDNNFQPYDDGLGTTISPAPSEGAWMALGFTRDNTNGSRFIWWNSSLTYQADEYVLFGGSGTPNAMNVGTRAFYDDTGYIGKYAFWKVWDAVLTQTEMETDLASATFVRTANANTGFTYTTSDISGNGRDWTHAAGVTLDNDDGPPVSEGPPAAGPKLHFIRSNLRWI